MTDRATRLANAWHRGNFAEAYETRECDPGELKGEERKQFVLGFFASYELHEVPADWRDKVAELRARS